MSKTDLTYGTLVQHSDGSLFIVIGFDLDSLPILAEVSQTGYKKNGSIFENYTILKEDKP